MISMRPVVVDVAGSDGNAAGEAVVEGHEAGDERLFRASEDANEWTRVGGGCDR
jgi:hypothetical protein